MKRQAFPFYDRFGPFLLAALAAVLLLLSCLSGRRAPGC